MPREKAVPKKAVPPPPHQPPTLDELSRDFTNLVVDFYDLFPNFEERIKEVYRDPRRPGGPIIQQQQCHWYAERNDNSKPPYAGRTRCEKTAEMYPYFCDVHAPKAYQNLVVKESFDEKGRSKGLGLFTIPKKIEDPHDTNIILYKKDEIVSPYYAPHYLKTMEESEYLYVINKPATDEEKLKLDGIDITINSQKNEYFINPRGTQTCIARYANHSNSRPNAWILPWDTPTMSKYIHPFLVAREDIGPDTEIVFDYGNEFQLGDNDDQQPRSSKRQKLESEGILF